MKTELAQSYMAQARSSGRWRPSRARRPLTAGRSPLVTEQDDVTLLGAQPLACAGLAPGQLPGAAAQVHHAHSWPEPHQAQDVQEGLAALAAETVVLRGVPDVLGIPGLWRHPPP